ncbi:MAG TPA: 3D domain-containing protein [Gemmatimonadaceae bacterium]|nr:3D domain-containing protein [Gemmatimonadaceae bacterium]
MIAPTPVKGAPVVAPSYPPVPELPPFVGSGRPPKRPRRRLGKYASATFALVLVVAAVAGALRLRDGLKPQLPLEFLPVVVYAPIRLDGALVLGASRDWHVNRDTPLRFGDPVPVSLTAYCLKGMTRRDHYVREGIIASDPKVFPLGRYLEIYVGKTYYGRFLIDDTGGVIKGNKLDIWTPTCREARLFGRVKGTAVLVPKPRDAAADTVTTGRLGGAKKGDG